MKSLSAKNIVKRICQDSGIKTSLLELIDSCLLFETLSQLNDQIRMKPTFPPDCLLMIH